MPTTDQHVADEYITDELTPRVAALRFLHELKPTLRSLFSVGYDTRDGERRLFAYCFTKTDLKALPAEWNGFAIEGRYTPATRAAVYEP